MIRTVIFDSDGTPVRLKYKLNKKETTASFKTIDRKED